MPRAIWTGAVSFGLVSVPVKLYSATSSKTVRFNQLDSADHARIQQKRVNAQTGDEVPFERIVKGYEITPDRYVVLEPEELDSLDPKATRTIDIDGFVKLDEIDPIYYDHAYYLVPAAGGAKPYRLLVDAMREAGYVGIAKVVLRSKESLVALRPIGEVLGMSTMLFADEVVDGTSLDEVPAADEVETSKRELDVAKQLVESLAEPWEPDKYKDTYRERVLALIEQKASGEEITIQPASEEPSSPVPDLMSALKASLDAVREKDGAKDAPKKSAPAKPKPKPAAKKKAAAKS